MYTTVRGLCWIWQRELTAHTSVLCLGNSAAERKGCRRHSPIFTTGQLFLHSCRHFLGLHLQRAGESFCCWHGTFRGISHKAPSKAACSHTETHAHRAENSGADHHRSVLHAPVCVDNGHSSELVIGILLLLAPLRGHDGTAFKPQ